MKVKFYEIQVTGLIVLSALFFFLGSRFTAPVPINRSEYIVPPSIIKNLSGGFHIQMSDSFWIRAIQDFDYCDQPSSTNQCKGKSWLYHIVNLTTDLDKKFQEAYFYGGLALTVIINDFVGASAIFDKGVQEFPDDWHLNYAAGYHALYEEKDKVKAARLYLAAAIHGAPNWVRVMAGKLAAESGDTGYAEQILENMILENEEPKLVERLKQKLEQIRSEKK